MKLLHWIVAVATALVGLALMVDARSRPPQREEVSIYQPLASLPIHAPGRIEGADEPLELRAELIARVRQVLVEDGQFVRPGQELITLDSTLLEAELREATAAVQAAEAALQRLRAGAREEERQAARQRYEAAAATARRHELRWRRLLELWERQGTDRRELDEQQLLYLAALAEAAAAKANYDLVSAPPRLEDLQEAEARLEAARAQQQRIRSLLEKTVLRAPIECRILEIHCQPGEMVGPQDPRPAVVAVDTRRPMVRAFIEEWDAPRASPGSRADISVDGLPGTTLRGTVRRVSPRMVPKELFSEQPQERLDTEVREVWIELQEPTDLPVGLRVDVVIWPQSTLAGQAPEQPLGPQAVTLHPRLEESDGVPQR
jgi:multidrug resistance efflux pump